MKTTRRKILAGIAVFALAVCDQQEANAILFSGSAAAAPGSSLLKTVTVENTSGSASPTNTHPDTFGIPIKKADLASGSYPILKTSGGTVIDATYWCLSKHPTDSSSIMMGCLARFPDAISGSSTADLKVYSGGSAPSASNRTLSEVYAATLLVEAVGHASSNDNLSGTWTAELQAANLIETIVYGDGPAGKVWKLTVPFKQSGSAHGQLICSFYLMALQDGSGNLAGFRVMPCVRMPYYNVDSPAKVWRGFSSLKLKYGAGPTVFDPIANSYSAKTFTYSGGGNLLNSTAHGLAQGCAVRLTTTGTLPTGLSADTTYWVYRNDANSLYFLDGCQSGATGQGTSVIAVTGAGSGTHTMTPCDYICHFGKKFIATTSGKFVYVQGGGSVSADTTLRIKHDKTYDHTTRLLPPFRTSVNAQVTSNTAYDWAPQGIGALLDYIGNTGERDDIGLISGFHSKHWFTQAAVDERVSRIVGLAMAHLSVDVKTSTLLPLNMSQGSYTGFPSSVAATVRWNAFGATVAGFTAPSGGAKVCAAIFRGPDLSHQVQHVYYTYLHTGEPQYYDMLMDCPNMFLLGSTTGDRDFTVGATTYYGVGPAGKDSVRTGAWCYREMLMPSVVVADTSPDGLNWKGYLRDQAAIQSAYMVAYLATLSSWAQNSGFWHPQSNTNSRSVWQMGYLWWVTCFHAAALEDSNAMTMVSHFAKWPEYVRTLTGNLWCLMTYYEISSKTRNQSGSPLIDSDAEWGPWANVTNLSWTISGNQFTWNTPNWTPANGDKVMFWAVARPGSNFSYMTQYYAVNVSGNNFQLAATPGGSAIVVQSNDSLTGGTWSGQYPYPQFAITTIPANPPTTGGVNGFIYDAGYAANAEGCMKYSKALGCSTDLTSCLSDMATRLSGVTWASPKYCMQDTF